MPPYLLLSFFISSFVNATIRTDIFKYSLTFTFFSLSLFFFFFQFNVFTKPKQIFFLSLISSFFEKKGAEIEKVNFLFNYNETLQRGVISNNTNGTKCVLRFLKLLRAFSTEKVKFIFNRDGTTTTVCFTREKPFKFADSFSAN